ncbi:MAG: polysaccharide deacetylase family protein [Gammaproteobacteria bacterium]|jgi:peptidoglycan/xylan/chitin deacetylase (PgdA/CDA1 family)|nr:polysaccharide deacetylase family protein [Gammaproteobacteria bacterium]
MTRLLALIVALAAGLSAEASQERHGVILLYHHVSGDTPPSTSVTPERFEAHLDYLEEHDFAVWPLHRLLDASIRGQEAVPENVVAITFDDAYESVHAEAWPRLRERGWPFAVFVNTDAVDAGHSPYMDWDQLRVLYENGITIGNHSAGHGHLIARSDGEGWREWARRVASDIDRADRRIAEEIGAEPDLFAYPYGEDSARLAAIVGERHDFALAQRSGAVGARTDPLSVPRFPMASGFDDMARFALAVRSRPLPVVAAEPSPKGDGVRESVDSLVIELAEGGYRLAQLACYASSGTRLDTRSEAGPPHRIAIEIGARGSTGRNKINCTAPAADGSGDYFWYAFQWVQDAVRD